MANYILPEELHRQVVGALVRAEPFLVIAATNDDAMGKEAGRRLGLLTAALAALRSLAIPQGAAQPISELSVTAALQASYLRDTPQSRKDMRRALEAVFAPQGAEAPQIRNRGLLQAAKQALAALKRHGALPWGQPGYPTPTPGADLLYEASGHLEPAIAREEAFCAAIAEPPAAVQGADQRKPWEKTSWECALATVTPSGVRCPEEGRCRDCIASPTSPQAAPSDDEIRAAWNSTQDPIATVRAFGAAPAGGWQASQELAARLRRLSGGREEWHVADPQTGAYCMSFDREHEAHEWFAEHCAQFPNSPHIHKEVKRVRVHTELENAALEAASILAPPLSPSTPTDPLKGGE